MMKALLILLLFCSLAYADITGRVVAVIDGDTIKVLDADNTEYKVRLTDISYRQISSPYGRQGRKYSSD